MSTMKTILAVDPGPEVCGWAVLENGRVAASGVSSCDEVLAMLLEHPKRTTLLAIEMIASYGMPVGREVFETCVFIGRLIQAWSAHHRLVYRKDVKMHLCGTNKANDANVRQALLDKIGPQGTKKAPGPTYGVKSHAWAALGVAVTANETEAEGCSA